LKTSVSQFEDDINDEFNKIWDNVRIHLYGDLDIKRKKEFLATHVPNEVMRSSKILLDTVINALMKEASDELKSASAELQNKFYDYNFRKKVNEWTALVENKLSLNPEYVKYSGNPQMTNGLIYSGITFITGVAITKIDFIHTKVNGLIYSGITFITGAATKIDFIHTKAIGAIASAIVILILSAAIFKLAYDKSKPKSISKMKENIVSYLESSKEQLIEYLDKVIRYFDKEFKTFYKENSWEMQ